MPHLECVLVASVHNKHDPKQIAMVLTNGVVE